MIYSREEHIQFLETECRAENEAYIQKLDTSALFMLQEREELFVAQFMKFQDGEMILKFSNNRSLPRQGEYLYCFTVPKELRDYHNWEKRTYGDLIKAKDNYSDAVCIWQASTDDKDFGIAGFRGIDLEFATHIQDTEGMILLLGPNKPPYEYIANLQNIVTNQTNVVANKILDQDFQFSDWTPLFLDNKKSIPDFILTQLQFQNTIIIQGPPGTGKTHIIAEICEQLCNDNKSVLVTALTNRALIEIIEKPALKRMLKRNSECYQWFKRFIFRFSCYKSFRPLQLIPKILNISRCLSDGSVIFISSWQLPIFKIFSFISLSSSSISL